MNLAFYALRFILLNKQANAVADELKGLVEHSFDGLVGERLIGSIGAPSKQSLATSVKNLLSNAVSTVYRLETELLKQDAMIADPYSRVQFGETPVDLSYIANSLIKNILSGADNFVESKLQTNKADEYLKGKVLRDAHAIGYSAVLGASWLARYNTPAFRKSRVMTPIDARTCEHCKRVIGSRPTNSALPHMRARSTIVYHGIVPPRTRQDWASAVNEAFSLQQDLGLKGELSPTLQQLERMNELVRERFPAGDPLGV